MSLTVPGEMVKQAETGRVEEMDFVTVVRESLPRAWRIVEGLVEKLRSSDTEIEAYGSGAMDDATRGELLRMLAGTAIRRTTERHFGVQLLFQNCHNVAVVDAGQEDSAVADEFCSIESQILNQRPQFQFC
jgi:hypothetical protein